VVAGPAVAIVTRTGISLDEVQQALRVLTTSPSFFEVVSPTRPISSVVRPTARALQVAGAWPSPEALLTNLVAAINNQGEVFRPQLEPPLGPCLGSSGYSFAFKGLLLFEIRLGELKFGESFLLTLLVLGHKGFVSTLNVGQYCLEGAVNTNGSSGKPTTHTRPQREYPARKRRKGKRR
jgi:hypothetical protein